MAPNNKSVREQFLEELFEDLTHDLNLNETFQDFSKRVVSQGYVNNPNVYVPASLDVGMALGITPPTSINSGVTYVQNGLLHLKPRRSVQEQYINGYLEAMRLYYMQLEDAKNNLNGLYDIIVNDARKKKNMSHNQMRRDQRLYLEGYLNALEDWMEILKGAKRFMMSKVKEDLMRNRYGSYE